MFACKTTGRSRREKIRQSLRGHLGHLEELQLKGGCSSSLRGQPTLQKGEMEESDGAAAHSTRPVCSAACHSFHSQILAFPFLLSPDLWKCLLLVDSFKTPDCKGVWEMKFWELKALHLQECFKSQRLENNDNILHTYIRTYFLSSL